MTKPNTAAVIIGRNEGAHLLRCLASVKASVSRIVYVDSGSTDGSIEAARTAGVTVVSLDNRTPFTAARARNAGLEALRGDDPPDYIQFIDGDCELRPGWIPAAVAFLDEHHEVAVACGRRRERYPDASLYNSLCDREWDTPIGLSQACGGDALIRRVALEQIGGYNASLIAAEDTEMCMRLRMAGWVIWRIDAEMTLHDIAMTRFTQFWKRERRTGHAFAAGAALHGATPERYAVSQLRRALLWGAALPLSTILLAGVAGWWGLGLLLLYPLQIARMAWRDRHTAKNTRTALGHAALLTVGKLAEAGGVFDYYRHRLLDRPAVLIEYK